MNKRRKYLIFFITIFSLNSYSQISFEKGYYVDNLGEKTNCLIRNIDWNNNPVEFEYKLSEATEPIIATIKFVSEFEIYNELKYQRFTVDIDRSSETTSEISISRSPIFKKEQLFLKVLVEGKANLFLYQDSSLKRFFYKIDTSSVEQLIFKSYLISKNSIAKNNTFKYQLIRDLKCQDISSEKLKNVDYYKKELTNLFVEYNECLGSKSINFGNKLKRDLFNLNVRVGLNNSAFTVEDFYSKDYDLGNKLGVRVGVEAEFILPFNKNKWAVIIEPTYQSYNSEYTESAYPRQNIKVDYKSIELPIGVRYYMFFNDNSKLFFNAMYMLNFSLDSKISFKFGGGDFDIKPNSNIALGIGYNQNKKYSIELRYIPNRHASNGFMNLFSLDYNAVSLIFGYSIF